MRFHIIKDADDLRAHEARWREDEARGSVPNVFATFDWIDCYWRVFGGGKQLWVAIGHRGEATAIAPLMITHGAGRSLRRLELIGAGIHDYSDFIVAPGDESSARALWSHMVRHHDAWDSLRLSQLHEDSTALRHAPDNDGLRNTGGRVHRIERAEGEACPSLSLPTAWDDYLQMLGKNMRYDLKRYARKMETDFHEVRMRVVRTHEEVDAALEALITLHTARWRKRGLPGVLATPKRKRFQRELAHALLERDRLRMFVLELDGAPAAVLLNYCFGGRYFFYIGGFDPDRERYRPGTILFGHAIRHAIEEGVTEFDFLRGREEYKYRLGAEDRHYHNLVITKDSLRSRAAATHARLGDKLLHHARKFAEQRYKTKA